MEYYVDPTTRYPARNAKNEPEICSTGMRILEEALDPEGTNIRILRSPILISLDLEYSSPAQEIDQVGIATLDTRALAKLNADDDEEQFKAVIGRRLLLIKHERDPPHQYSRPYIFGCSEVVQSATTQLHDTLVNMFTPLDDLGRKRNVIIVGHTVREDMKALKLYAGIDLSTFSSITAIIDTASMAAFLYPNISFRQSSLKMTCRYVGLEPKHLHNAGNDAFFALLALLLMFHHYKSEKQYWKFDLCFTPDHCGLWQCQLEVLRRIGRVPHISLPVRVKKIKQLKLPIVRNNLGDILDGITRLYE